MSAHPPGPAGNVRALPAEDATRRRRGRLGSAAARTVGLMVLGPVITLIAVGYQMWDDSRGRLATPAGGALPAAGAAGRPAPTVPPA
ncbi:hypothetical protein, partial [Pigmentiphaga soli]|uniref:hypothetical protein n=1 Tax=Pigmentiphaga soli TaxID=1007095 RepID=UPI003CD0944B